MVSKMDGGPYHGKMEHLNGKLWAKNGAWNEVIERVNTFSRTHSNEKKEKCQVP